jgi:lysophospholipid acyltransferase (LPLAT)-like uncharacterized protein
VSGKLEYRVFSWRDRLVLAVLPRVVAAWIAVVGGTLRFVVVVEDGAEAAAVPARGIYCFWHECTFAAGWFFRRYNACILISRSFDGELIARTLGLLGFRSVRGSSSRGAVAGFLQLRQEVMGGGLAIFTADGPRGPVHRSKMGPVKLSQRTGVAIGCFHLEPERAWRLGSWDGFALPVPFSRVVVSWARSVPAAVADADAGELERVRGEVDAALERARLQAQAWLRVKGVRGEVDGLAGRGGKRG